MTKEQPKKTLSSNLWRLPASLAISTGLLTGCDQEGQSQMPVTTQPDKTTIVESPPATATSQPTPMPTEAPTQTPTPTETPVASYLEQEPAEAITYPVDEEEIERLGLEVETPSAYTYVNQDIIARTLIEMNIKKLNANEPKILLVSAPTLKREINNLIKESPDISVEKIIQYLEQDTIQLSPEEKEQFVSQLQIIEAFCQQNLDPESIPASVDAEKWQEAIQSALEHSNYINLELYQNATWDEQLDTLILKPEKEDLPDIAHLFESMVYIQRITVPEQYVDNKPLELIHATDVAEEGYVDFSQADLQVVSEIFRVGRNWLKRALIRPDHQDFPTNRVVLGVLNGVGEVAEYDEQSLFIPIRNLPGSGSLRMHPVKNQAGEIAYGQGGLDWPYDHEKIQADQRQTLFYLTAILVHSTSIPLQAKYNEQVTSFETALKDMANYIESNVPSRENDNPANLQFIPMK
jgi:hypothetical protein